MVFSIKESFLKLTCSFNISMVYGELMDIQTSYFSKLGDV
uniref:Uncharacterized protein n=1 Tax=Bacteriophage sp. TaxID=38018 RepID=A0A8D9PEB9_9VIRU|nr:MAG TPA: hypothetical protein [Bacteriophage sp.]